MYLGIVEPHIRYCCSVWGCAGDTVLQKLQKKIQNRAARIVTNSPFDKASLSLISQLKWVNIKEMIDFEAATMVYKSLHGLAPPYMQDMFHKLSDRRNRVLQSTETDLEIPRYKTFNGQRSYFPGGGVLHYWVRRGCAPVLGSFWPENSGIGICFYWKM